MPAGSNAVHIRKHETKRFKHNHSISQQKKKKNSMWLFRSKSSLNMISYDTEVLIYKKKANTIDFQSHV